MRSPLTGNLSVMAQESLLNGHCPKNIVKKKLSIVITSYSIHYTKLYETLGLAGLSVASAADAGPTIGLVDTALEGIDAIRGTLGAVQNRFEYTISNLNSVAENLTAARSRIMDADIAQETSRMTRANILQQSGVSILTQANQTPQLALQLLQG